MAKSGKLPSVRDLRALSLRAIVAYAARCARRAQPLYRSDSQRHIDAIDKAIAVAEAFAQENIHATTCARAAADAAAVDASTHADLNAFAAARAAHAAVAAAAHAAAAADADADADHARDAVRAATNAADAVRAADAARGAISDFQRLRSLTSKPFPALGDPIDFDALGPLWPDGEPEWFAQREIPEEVEDRGVAQEPPSEDDLIKLSHRAMVAYAARCARRVRPLFWSDSQEHIDAVDQAIAVAEAFAQGQEFALTAEAIADAAELSAARGHAMKRSSDHYESGWAASAASAAAASAGHTERAAGAADRAANGAACAADRAAPFDARAATYAAVTAAAISDYRQLVGLVTQPFPALGDPIDFDALGPLWPNGEPEWFPERKTAEEADEELAARIAASDPEPLISLCFDDSGFTESDVSLILEYLNEVYGDLGGLGLKVVDGNTLCPEYATEESL